MIKTIMVVISLGLAMLATGCYDSFYGHDSLGNPTDRTWKVTAAFASGRVETYTLHPKTFGNYTATERGQEPPVLTNLLVAAMDPQGTRYSMTIHEISKLRSASKGELRLVLYDEGLAVLSPATTRALKRGKTLEDFVHTLKVRRKECLSYTRQILEEPDAAGRP